MLCFVKLVNKVEIVQVQEFYENLKSQPLCLCYFNGNLTISLRTEGNTDEHIGFFLKRV